MTNRKIYLTPGIIGETYRGDIISSYVNCIYGETLSEISCLLIDTFELYLNDIYTSYFGVPRWKEILEKYKGKYSLISVKLPIDDSLDKYKHHPGYFLITSDLPRYTETIYPRLSSNVSLTSYLTSSKVVKLTKIADRYLEEKRQIYDDLLERHIINNYGNLSCLTWEDLKERHPEVLEAYIMMNGPIEVISREDELDFLGKWMPIMI